MSLLTRPRPDAAPAVPAAPAETGRHRPRLRMPHGLTSGKFAATVGLVLAAGLVALLMVNTSLAAGAIELSGLENRLARTTEQQQALELEVEGLSAPATLQAAAAGLGMVPAGAPAFLDPATGQLSGDRTPASPPAKPFEQASQFAPKPEPTPTPSPTDEPFLGPNADLTPAPPSPGPAPSAVAPADPGADGATVIVPGAGPTAAVTPDQAPVPAPSAGVPAATGDAATVTTEVD